MKIIETVTTRIDFDVLEKNIKEWACPQEMPRIEKWMKRLKKEGTLFIRKQHKMRLAEYQSVYFSRFCTFVDMSIVYKNLTCTIEK